MYQLAYDSYETIDHVPSSCIVVMVHVVKGRQHSAYTVPRASIAEMERLSISIVTSFDASITGMNLTAQYSFY
jgi:hypothetical protein